MGLAQNTRLKFWQDNIYNVKLGGGWTITNSPHHVNYSCYATVQMFI